jgi:Domain of unknown function (DUF1840)
MLYRFKSGATGDVIMTASRGDQLLDIIGKAPTPKGIVAAAALPAAIQALEQAVAAEEASATDTASEEDKVTLRQRAWPLVDMFRRAQQANVAVVWGV